jgi:hypothetical protein
VLFQGNSAEVILRLIAARAADPEAQLPLEYATMTTGAYPVSGLHVDVADTDRDAAEAAAEYAQDAADDVVGAD